MAKYRVVLRYDLDNTSHPILWEPGCPLLVEAAQISKNTETSECCLQTKVRNISQRTIEGFELLIDIQYGDGTCEAATVRAPDAAMQGGAEFLPTPQKIKGSDPVSLATTVCSVKLDNNTWSSDGNPSPLPELSPLSLSPKQAKERKIIITETAKGIVPDWSKGLVKQDNWWLCPCGALNVDRGQCHKCGFQLSELTDLENPGYLKKAASKLRKRKMRLAIGCVAIILILTLLFICRELYELYLHYGSFSSIPLM